MFLSYKLFHPHAKYRQNTNILRDYKDVVDIFLNIESRFLCQNIEENGSDILDFIGVSWLDRNQATLFLAVAACTVYHSLLTQRHKCTFLLTGSIRAATRCDL